MNKILTACASVALLSGCATTRQPALATACFHPSTLVGHSVEAQDAVVVNDGIQYWRVHLRGSCPELQHASYLVFSDEMALKPWPNQPWREGYGQMTGWPDNGFYVNRSSDFMKVCSNRMSWVHPFNAAHAPLTGQYASWGCRVDTVEPLWR